MSTQIDFGPALHDLGRVVVQELVKTDYGPGSSFDGIGGHGPEDHGPHGLHEQVNLFKTGVKDSGLTVRFLDK